MSIDHMIYATQIMTNGFTYKDAASAACLEEKKIMMFVQVIDRYFGNMSAIFAFKEDEAYAHFNKTAECFLKEYEGCLVGKRIDKK